MNLKILHPWKAKEKETEGKIVGTPFSFAFPKARAPFAFAFPQPLSKALTVRPRYPASRWPAPDVQQ